ncbi:type I secretion C-terminal target domain-containing protein, partial [Acinetobacter sp. YH16032]|uniref:type I secretion C-terminal target domain-containing protein n=1 Tax=Acinetobacter sp. YH16032 TaxID=2601181 RepID=UPI0015D108DE
DEYEQVLADAEASVEAAEAAYAAAEQALIDANANGLITPTELTALTQARDDALAAKTEAQTKVTALPEAVQAAKDALQGRLNDLVDITLPTVNDQNENDISDDIDTLLAGVEALIESAEEAYTTAEEDLADALQDGTVTQAEADKLQESLEAAQAAKTLAQQALDNIDQTSDAIEAAKALLQERIDDLVDIEVPEPFATANNDVQLVLDITPTVDVNETPTELNSTGFTVGSVGLGPVLNASVLESVFSSSVSLSVEEGTERDISFYADAGGLTAGTMNLFMYKLNESTGEYELKEKIDNWYLVVLGGVSETISRSLDEGEWLIVLGNGQGLSAATGYTLRFESDAVRDFNNPEAVTGTINGNVITDQDYQNGTDVVPEGSKISGVIHGEDTINQFTDGIATIKGEYGTLTISENGQYTYTVDPLFRDYGEVDRFVYEVTAPNGEKRTAELNIELVRVATDENAIIDNTVLLDVTPDLTETTGEELGISNAVALNLLDLGIAGDVLSASVIGTEGVMDFTVEDGTFQEMTFTGSAGGVTILSTFSLVIYRLDENTEQLVQVHEIPNFVQVLIGGGVSTPVTLSFGEGTYVGIIKQTSGVNVIGGASAQVTDVNIYDYANPETITGSVQGDATPITTDKLILVNNTDVVEGEALVVQGQYGSLNINTDGTYTYNVTVPQSTVGWTPPYGEIDRFEVVVERADGTTYIEVLNIKIDTNTVANDAEVVEVQAANYSTLNESVESGIIGSASRTLEFKVEEGSYISSLDLQGNITRTLTNDNPSMSVVINKVTTQLVNGVEQQVLEQVYTGNVSITWPAGTILNPSTSTTYASEIILDDGKVLDAGDYVISINTTSGTFNSVNVSSASITGIMVNNITPTDTPLLEGDLFENDTAIDQIDILKIGSKELYVNDPAKGGQEFTVQGKHGVLTVFKDGTYEYQPSGLSGGLETFTYTTVSKAGTSQSATLEINVSMTLTGSDEADTAQASASIDTFTLGEGADTVLYDVLNQAQHTESPDIWTDFNQAEGDRVDISALLKDQNVTSSNIGEFVTIKQDGANTVISVDTDGAKTKYNPTELIVLQNTDSSLYAIDDLLKYNQI